MNKLSYIALAMATEHQHIQPDSGSIEREIGLLPLPPDPRSQEFPEKFEVYVLSIKDFVLRAKRTIFPRFVPHQTDNEQTLQEVNTLIEFLDDTSKYYYTLFSFRNISEASKKTLEEYQGSLREIVIDERKFFIEKRESIDEKVIQKRQNKESWAQFKAFFLFFKELLLPPRKNRQ